MLKKALLTSAAVAAVATSSVATADVTGNFAVTNNYLFRGIEFSGGAPAVQGGLDYSHESGAYAGVWLSNTTADGNSEIDYYAGFASGAFDTGVIYYAYTEDDDGGESGNLLEVYGGVSGDSWDAKLWYGFGVEGAEDDEYVYLEGNYSVGSFDLHAGVNQVIGDAREDNGIKDNQLDLGVAYNVGDFTLGAVWLIQHDRNADGAGNSANNERPNFYISWGQEFEVK